VNDDWRKMVQEKSEDYKNVYYSSDCNGQQKGNAEELENN